MQELLDNGRRAEVYIYYQQLAGKSMEQLMMQAQGI